MTYQLINTGNTLASSIDIADNYDLASFDMVDNVDAEGFVSQRYEELAPSAQVSFNVTVRPKLFGVYESTRARIRYLNAATSGDGMEDSRQGYSTSLGRTRIFSAAEHERSTSYFVKDWLTLLVLCALPVALPLRLYTQAKNRLSVFSNGGGAGAGAGAVGGGKHGKKSE